MEIKVPWSPVPHFPKVIEDLRRTGYIKEVTFHPLRVSIMRVIGIVKDQSIKQSIRTMEDLGYIRKKDSPSGQVWEISQGQPGNFKQDDILEEERITEDLVEDLPQSPEGESDEPND